MHAIKLPARKTDLSVASRFLPFLQHIEGATDTDEMRLLFFQGFTTCFIPWMLLKNMINDHGKPTGRQYRQCGVKICHANAVTFLLHVQVADGWPMKHIGEGVQRSVQNGALRETLDCFRNTGLTGTRRTIQDYCDSLHDFAQGVCPPNRLQAGLCLSTQSSIKP